MSVSKNFLSTALPKEPVPPVMSSVLLVNIFNLFNFVNYMIILLIIKFIFRTSNYFLADFFWMNKVKNIKRIKPIKVNKIPSFIPSGVYFNSI